MWGRKFLIITILFVIFVLISYLINQNNFFWNIVGRSSKFCDQFSGSAGYMQGEILAKKCVEVGCQISNKKEYFTTQETQFCNGITGDCRVNEMVIPDSGWYTFVCVP